MPQARGISLPEVLVTVTLLGIVAMLTIPRTLNVVQNSRIQMAAIRAYDVQRGLHGYYLNHGRYPDRFVSLTDLATALEVPGLDQVATDPDDGLYQRKTDGTGFVVRIKALDRRGTMIIITESAVLVQG